MVHFTAHAETNVDSPLDSAVILAAHDGTRVGGYLLSKTMLGPPSKEVAHYKLAYEPER